MTEFVQPLVMGKHSLLKAGTEIRCENGHTQAVVTEDIEKGAIHYGRFFKWHQSDPAGSQFPVLCDKCNGVLITLDLTENG